MKYRLINWILFFLVILLAINIVRSWVYLSKRGGIIDEYQAKRDEEIEKQEQLKRKLAQVESKDYIEREARNRLNLGKEEEIVIMLPSLEPTKEPLKKVSEAQIPNWEKWIKLFI